MKPASYKILIAFGTRPELIKLAPVINVLRRREKLILVNSGQHSQLLDQALHSFNIAPDINLFCENPDLLQNFHDMSLRMRDVIYQTDPDFILVQGDTLTTFATSIVAFLMKKPIIHLEAGLRSKSKYSPFPEEIFRIMTDDVAEVYLTPTEKAKQNLLSEGKRADRIFTVGNTIVDALNFIIRKINTEQGYCILLDNLKIGADKYRNMSKVLITTHRRENIGEPLKNICYAVKKLCNIYRDFIFIWILHRNPWVRSVIEREFMDRPDNLVFIEALPYELFLLLMKDCILLMSDSGGVQEEAPSLGKPVIILRDTTERPEIIETGLGYLVGSDIEKIIATFEDVYNKFGEGVQRRTINPFGDGRASERFLKLIECEVFHEFIRQYPRSSFMSLEDCRKFIDEFKI